MAYNDLRAAIKTLLESITDIGQVHNRNRWSDNWATFLSLFATDLTEADSDNVRRIRGWMISRTRKMPDPAGASRGGASDYLQDFVIRGVMGFSDSEDSEGTFNALVDSVLAKLNSDKDLSGQTIDHSAKPAEARVIDLRMFGQTLCHYVEIRYGPHTLESHN